MPKILQVLRALQGGNRFNIILTPEQSPIVDGLTPRMLYATQANLHAVISFLADSIAQLPLKVYIRDGENERRRDRTSRAARLLYRPNADQTSYEFLNALATELLLMGISTVWILPDPDSESGNQLRIIPKEWIVTTERETNYAPDMLRVTAGSGSYIDIPATEFTQFRMYSPGNPGGYQSPISALKQTLSEQIQADRFRTEIWRRSGRFNAYITRPANVQPWNDETRSNFVKMFRENWGRGGENAGKMPLMEDGMEVKPYQFNSKEAQYAETKQLSREDVAAAYHVNPALIWHTSNQTYASAKDNARALYADCLGPIIQMLQQRINAFLLPMIGADPNTYVEFDLTEKLKGSFEERASIIQASVGGPWLTRNEARADNNLPPIDGGDELIVPLNVISGGQASPQDTHMQAKPPAPPGRPAENGVIEFPIKCGCEDCRKENGTAKTDHPEVREEKSEEPGKQAPAEEPERKEPGEIRIKGKSERDEDENTAAVLKKFFRRQAASVLPKIGAGREAWWDEDRWNEELASDLEPAVNGIADSHGKSAAAVMETEYSEARTRAYLKKLTEGRATAINAATREKLQAVIDEEDEEEEPADVFEKREDVDSDTLGKALATAVSSWAVIEACNQAEEQGYRKTVQKEWVTGDNPRPSHAAMNGQTVPIHETFSNGARWPGDDVLGPEETCGCNCSTAVVIS